MKEFVHHELGGEVRAIGGQYTLVRECRMPYGRREILYVVGYALFDASCCGSGGCGYAIVPGFIRAWKSQKTTNDEDISLVEPVSDAVACREITEIIKKRELVQQVQFTF